MFGLDGLRIKAKQVQKIKDQADEMTQTQPVFDEVPPMIELVFVSDRGTFRSGVYTYTKGELILEKVLPRDLHLDSVLEVALVKTWRSLPETLHLAGAENQKAKAGRKETLVLRVQPVPGVDSRKLRILQLNREDFEKLQNILTAA